MAATRITPIGVEELSPDGPLLQSRFWARLKKRFGWTPLAFRTEAFDLLILVRSVVPGFLLGYCPHGPAVAVAPLDRTQALLSLTESLHGYLAEGCGLLRFDPLWTRRSPEDSSELDLPLRRARVDVQPPDTVIVDLDGEEDEILSRMKSKTRYNIRLAERRGVVVRESGIEGLDLWYRMYRETASRDRITIHAERYYRALFEEARRELAATGAQTRLLFAYVEDEAVAGNIVTISGRSGLYHFGASTNRHRNLMPTYALQWEAMKLCLHEGCTEYDLGGIPPTDDPAHPMHGLYRMKTGFGGRIVHRVGSWDSPLRPFAYRGFRAAEAVRNYYFKHMRKRLR